MNAPVADRADRLTADTIKAVSAAFIGWTMDAFDYFVVVLIYADVGADFGVSLTRMAFLTTVTLLMRPVGAAIFGVWADRVGRKRALIADVSFYSLVGFVCAFAPNYTTLLVLRLLYGIGMGGEWGLGAALAMEKVPPSRRGLVSGVLQQGYAIGYLLAALAYLLVRDYTSWGWRGLFALSILPALLSLFLRAKVTESATWAETHSLAQQRQTKIREILTSPTVVRRFVYLVLLMTAFNWMAHGTQDIYPTFLKKGLGFSPNTALYIAMLYNVGALIGGTLMGALSERIGRRAVVAGCALVGLSLLPLFAASHALWLICLGSFLTQFFVQGAWVSYPRTSPSCPRPRSAASTPPSPTNSATAWPRSTCRSRSAWPRVTATPSRSAPPWSRSSSRSRCWSRSARRRAAPRCRHPPPARRHR